MKHTEMTQMQTAEFCRNFALLLHGGLGLADSVHLLAQEEKDSRLTSLGKLLDEGYPLSDALEQTGGFPPYVCDMIRIGEQTGHLEETLESLADYYEENDRTVRQLKSALTYPCTILLLMLAVISVLLMKVMPIFDSVYASLGSRLTGISAGLLYLGQMLQNALPVLLAVLAVILVSVFAVSRSRKCRNAVLGSWMRRFGDQGIARKFNNARLAGALSMGLGSGLSLEMSMTLARQLLQGNPGAASRLDACQQQLDDGIQLVDALQDTDFLSPWAGRMLAAGIRGGNGEQVMETAAKRMLEEARQDLDHVLSRIEPTMVLICSCLVGIILLSAMLPLMNILEVIG